MKLALALGWQSVEQMLNGMSFVELLDWLSYYSVEPFPEEREDFRVACSMALFANANRKPKSKELKPSDFMVDYWKLKTSGNEKPKPEVLFERAKLITLMTGGQIIKRSEQ